MLERNHYLTLGVQTNESVAGIRRAFREHVKRYHPDLLGPSRASFFYAIVEAYRTLSHPERRRDYDRGLSSAMFSAAQPVVATAVNRPAEQLIAELACIGCHKFDEPGPLVGPSLWDIGARQDEAYIRQSILEPNAVIAEGFPPMLMPTDLGEKMSGVEFERLVQWLKEHKGAKTQ